jgi:hypothetical protein
MVKIKIYYHVCMVNHWQDIVREQLDTIKSSGIPYETVNIGALGEQSQLEILQKIIREYENVGIRRYSTDIKQYEYFTLRTLKEDSDKATEKFYGAYIHVKGVSYPPEHDAHFGGYFWRSYMMHFTIREWQKNYRALDLKYMGYDLCGCKVVPKRVSPSEHTHFSGNFFMFNSEYVRSLKPIESLDTTNRFHAENWITSGEPIIYLNCNLFVDYFARHKDYDEFMNNYKDLPDFVL